MVNNIVGGDGLHGLIDSNGSYTAPLTPPPGGSTTITAISGTGSSTLSGTATAAITFSNESLNGFYAFSYKGSGSKGFLAAAGSFIAQGSTGASGQIFGGVEDVFTTGSSSAAHSQFTGTFAVNPDGSGSATLPNSVMWAFTLVSNATGGSARHALLIRFDAAGTGSGTLDAQNPALLTASAFSGNYAFGLSGIDGSGNPLSLAGRFFADGVGLIPLGSGVQDINDNGKSTLSLTSSGTTTSTAGTVSTSTADTTLQGSFVMDATVPTSGRGTVTLSSTNTSVFANGVSVQLAFYIVDNTHLKVVEVDNTAGLAGDFYSAANTPSDGAFTSTSAFPPGSYAFAVEGTSSNGAYASGGIFNTAATSSGSSGNVTGVLDINNGAIDIQMDSSITSTSFSIDPSFGRIALPITANGVTRNFAGYTAAYNTINGPVQFIELIELDTNVTASGFAYPQNGTASPISGAYALSLAGVSGPKNGATEEDILGQISTIGTTSLSGALNINNFAASLLTPHTPLTSATSVITPTSNGRGTATVGTNAATYSLAYYVIDASTALVLETDGAHVTTGMLLKQY